MAQCRSFVRSSAHEEARMEEMEEMEERLSAGL